MPVTFEDYLKLQFNLEKLGFREATDKQRLGFLAQMRRHGYVEPRYPPRGGETCFIYVYGKYIVVFWTSCLLRTVRDCRWQMERCPAGKLPFYLGTVVSRPPGEDAARILILERKEDGSEKPRYFARYVNRTKGFVNNGCKRAWVTAYKVSHPPECEKCGAEMNICENDDGGHYWGCFSVVHELYERKEDRGPFFQEWHHGLPEKARKIAEAWDRDFEKQLRKERAKRRKEGKKPPERAFRIRARAKEKRRVA